MSLKIIEELKEKSLSVKWQNKKRIEYFGLIAKNIENKKDLRNKHYLVYDLEDF